jgi:hypothetical protein
MKLKKVIPFASLAMMLLSCGALAEDSNSSDMQKRSSNVPEVTTQTVVIPNVPEATTDIPKPVDVQTIYPNGEVAQSIDPKLKPNRPNVEIDINREFKHKRNSPVVFSSRTPAVQTSRTLHEDDIKVGDVKNSRVSLYLRGPYMKPKEVIQKLEEAKYKILSHEAIDKKKKLVSIVFTCSALESMGDKKGRGFAGSLRILVDGINNQISITNPLYMARAFMQDDFNEAIPKAALDMLRKTFSDLKDSEDILKYNLLPKYVFMSGMPAYEDMAIITKGDHAAILAKLKKSKNVLFIQELSKKRAVIGVELSKRTTKFINKAGAQNAALLPYPVLLEEGEAKILDPKYYIAVMYPLLKMGTFMKISTVPGAINNDVKKIFK